MKKILYVDMDGVLCDYKSAFIEARQRTPEIIYPQSQLGFFMNLKPLPMAYDMDMYFKIFDTYILTRPSVKNPLCYTEKRLWIEKYLGMKYCEKLIITPNKSLNKGDYLVDDNFWKFDGKLLLLGSEEFPSYSHVYQYLINNV
jgi:5'-nucleotidase